LLCIVCLSFQRKMQSILLSNSLYLVPCFFRGPLPNTRQFWYPFDCQRTHLMFWYISSPVRSYIFTRPHRIPVAVLPVVFSELGKRKNGKGEDQPLAAIMPASSALSAASSADAGANGCPRDITMTIPQSKVRSSSEPHPVVIVVRNRPS